MDRKNVLPLVLVILLTALVSSFATGAVMQRQSETDTQVAVSSSENRVVEVVKRANPAVVAITVSKNVPVYERYFENYFGFAVPQYRQLGTERLEVGGGSGFLVSSDGYIVTNSHVVSDQDAEYTVFMNDGRKYDTRIVARDPSLDLAIMKIVGADFPHLPFGNSDNVEIGQSVIAIGNALAEFRNTVSLGIVSGLARSVITSDIMGRTGALDQLIQTDAAINPGNSGGPLLNLEGEVIGVNVAMASGAENFGFAVSGNSVRNLVEYVRASDTQ